VVDGQGAALLARWGDHAVTNYRGLTTGEVRSVLVLDKVRAS